MIIRLRMPVTIQFRFRPVPVKLNLTPNHVYLHLRITVNGQRDAGFAARFRHIHPGNHQVSYGEYIIINKKEWDKKKLQLKGKDIDAISFNQKLDDIKFAIKDTLLNQQQRYDRGKAPRPTVDSVKFEYQSGRPPAVLHDQFVYPEKFLVRKNKAVTPGKKATLLTAEPDRQSGDLSTDTSLIDAFRALLIDLKVEKLNTGRMAKSTYFRREAVYQYLTKYPPAHTIAVGELTPFWVEGFHGWLLKQPSGNPEHKFHNKRMSVGTATAYCGCLNELLAWMKKQHLILFNPLVDLELEKNRTKEVIFLEGIYLDRLLALKMDPPESVALWWFKLICLTGMDFPDAVRYALSRSSYETTTPGGKPKIVIRRAKPPENVCNIPILDELLELWDEVGEEPPRVISDSTLISHLKVVRKAIDFPHHITPKVGRKTAGVIFLKYFSIKSVSNALGHSSIGTTERHYVKVTGVHVDHEMDRAA